MSARSLMLSLSMALLFAHSTGLLAQEPARSVPKAKGPANRLAKETSPYLLLHAHNPVDWYPWGPEAFAKAKAENKPIFLSVGYSSCYWCHVMERECFMNPGIAAILNDQFVNIKVDREERPDVDQVYMTALQFFTGQGGWPMSMFLTPEGQPFFGGTYFPPADRDGFEGFPTLLKRVVDAWRDHKPELQRDAERLATLVRRTLDGAVARKAPLSRALAEQGQAALAEQFDPEYGGFGFHPENPRRPKFPEPVNLLFLLDRHRRTSTGASSPKVGSKGQTGPLEMVELTLDRMARGGIRDQLAGGYHRYATSRYWIVPHFEKMLYDNAQLASAHLLAFERTGDPRWRVEAEAIFGFIGRTMTGPEGGFYSALDAETDGEEGAYYVWTRTEVVSALGVGPDVDAFFQVYGLARDPNFERDRYVLLEPRPKTEQADSLKSTLEDLEVRLAPLRAKLLAARNARPSPLRDDKVITSWNGLMIAAYADGYRLLKTPAYREAAEKAANFLLKTLRTPEGRLLRTYRVGQAKLPAYLEDYAFLAQGLLRLHAATGEDRWRDQAKAITDRMLKDFADPHGGGFFVTANDHETLIARAKDAVDNVLPSGNSVAIRNLVALGGLTGDPQYLDAAGKALEAFSGPLSQSPGSLPVMLIAMEEYLDARPETAGPAEDPLNDPTPLPGGQTILTAMASAKPAEAKPGETVAVAITLEVKPGWHAYANPTGVEGMTPTKLSLDPGLPVTLLELTYPRGVSKVLEANGSESVSLYEGRVPLLAKIKVKPDAKPGALILKFTVSYQACNDRACLPPARLAISVPVQVNP